MVCFLFLSGICSDSPSTRTRSTAYTTECREFLYSRKFNAGSLRPMHRLCPANHALPQFPRTCSARGRISIEGRHFACHPCKGCPLRTRERLLCFFYPISSGGFYGNP